jgi:hypothetical protein
MSNNIKTFFFLSIFFSTTAFGVVSASETLGTIDSANHFAAFVRATGSEVINFGNFTTQSAYNISINDSGLRGYAWGADAGWIVLNCLDTASGCTANNESFKVAVSDTGILSGYAWGQKTGWINFGPFANSATPQVQIGEDGAFKGEGGDVGYAWSQRYGWITFDCTDDACVSTDYIPSAYRGGTGVIGGSVGAGGTSNSDGIVEHSQCSDDIDNDTDGFTDYPGDEGCYGLVDNTENTSVVPVTPVVPSIPGKTTPGTPNNGTSFPTEPTTAPNGSVFPSAGTQPSDTVVPITPPSHIPAQQNADSLIDSVVNFIREWGLIAFLAILLLIAIVRKFAFK